MFFAVKLLYPGQYAAFDQTLKIAVNTGKSAPVKLLLELPPYLFRGQMAPAADKKLNDRLPARRELKPALFQLFKIDVHSSNKNFFFL